MKTDNKPEARPLKNHYDDPDLNRIANDRRWGRVFGEQTMLEMRRESVDEKEFIYMIEDGLNSTD